MYGCHNEFRYMGIPLKPRLWCPAQSQAPWRSHLFHSFTKPLTLVNIGDTLKLFWHSTFIFIVKMFHFAFILIIVCNQSKQVIPAGVCCMTRCGLEKRVALSELSHAFRLDMVAAFSRDSFLSSVCVGNSVQKESLAFITAELPDTFTENKTKQTLKLLWLIQFKFGSAARKCSKKTTTNQCKNSKTFVDIMQNRRRGSLCLGESLRKPSWKNSSCGYLKTASCFGSGDYRALMKASRHMLPVFNVHEGPFYKVLFNICARKDTQ